MQLDAFRGYIHLEGEVDFRIITLVLLAQFYDGVCNNSSSVSAMLTRSFMLRPCDGPVANFEVVHVASGGLQC